MLPRKTKGLEIRGLRALVKQHPATKLVWLAPIDESSYFCRELIPAFRSHRTSASEVEAWTRRDSNPHPLPSQGAVFPLHHGPTQSVRVPRYGVRYCGHRLRSSGPKRESMVRTIRGNLPFFARTAVLWHRCSLGNSTRRVSRGSLPPSHS
jgi:hypothetical protein